MLTLAINKKLPIQTLLLASVPEHFTQVAQWHHQECERQGLHSTFAVRQQRLLSHVQEQAVPKTIIALQGEQLVGCVSLVNYAYRAGSAQALAAQASPIWLSNLFVVESLRKQGIGDLLIEAAKAYAGNIGLCELYLAAAEHTEYYQKRGWLIERHTRLGGRQVNVMKICLTAKAATRPEVVSHLY